MKHTSYPYTATNLLETPNTYFYSGFEGTPFLRSWRESRLLAVAGIPEEPAPPARKTLLPAFPVRGDLLLEYLMHTIQSGEPDLDRLTLLHKNFEITKRVYGQYTEEIRAHKRTVFHDLEPYVRFAEIAEAMYERTRGLQWLNAWLKAMDTLCSVAQALPAGLRGRLAGLVARELESIKTLAGTKGMDIS